MTNPTATSTDKAAEQAAPGKSDITTTQRASVQMGVAPKSLDEGWRLAQWFAKSELVPKNFRNKPEDVLVAIQAGVELGLPPFQALASIAVINGRAGVWGDGFLALIVCSPLYRDHDEFYEVETSPGHVERRDGLTLDDLKKDSTAAVCTFVRANKATPVTRRFSVGQARKAGLLGKEGPWQNYPDRMLAMRARGFAGRDAFPDLLRGIRPAEELRDIIDDDASSTPRIVVAEVRRASETARQPLDARAHAGDGASAQREVAPPVKLDTLDPATVKGVAAFLGGFVATLGNGQQVDVTDAADAAELEKFVGTPQKVRLTIERTGSTMALRSFESAD